MTPEELERVLERQRTARGGYSVAYFIALLMVAVVLIILYGDA